MATLQLEIVTPTGAVVSQPVDSVQARSVEGYFEILPNHTEFLAALTVGHIRYLADGQQHLIATSGGVAEVSNNAVVILAETAESKDTIDVERAQQARERAELHLTAHTDDVDVNRARVALLRAINRLRIAGHG